MKVQVYIGEDKLDLFDDEKISITQKLNDIEKLSNVFTDFTNSFTVPATPNNNRILKHYYDVDVDGSFNANIRIDGFIEIDTLPFKFGQFQLEGVVVKQNRADNYKVTFYSKTVQLSKLFGDDTIDQLDYEVVDGERVKTWSSLSQFDFVNNQTNLLDSLNNPSFKGGNIITPLIAYADRDWNYGTNDSYDISNSTYPILTEELRQALRVIRIIEGIETKYGISFSRDFFGNTMFNQLFLWLNNSADKFFSTIADFTVPMTYAVPNPYYTGYLNLTTNIITFDDFAYNYSPTRVFLFGITFFGVRRPNETPAQLQGTKFTVSVINPNTGIEVFSDVVEHNGDFVQAVFEIPQSSVPISYDYQIFVSSSATFTFDRFSARFILTGVSVFAGSFDNPGTYLDNNLVSYLTPPMKVIDFLQGIMKMFKLVIRPTSITDFYINTLDSYYDEGTILDITKYVDVANVNIDRPSIYRRITFTFQPTDNVLGNKFRLTNDPIGKKIGYGDLRSDYPQITENNDLSVELPFENMLFERMVIQSPNVNVGDLTNINIGQSCKLNEDQTLSRNDSKPILFFNNGTIDISTYPLKYKYGTTASVQTLNSIYNIGNTDNQVFDDVTQTINWGSEVDPWHYVEAPQSLFNNYWKNWLETIYSIKQRKFKFEGYLPPRYIQELSLNDALIIGQNRYNISDYTIDLVTGKTIFNLFNDIKKQQQL